MLNVSASSIQTTRAMGSVAASRFAAGVLVIVDGLVLFGAAGADEEGAAGAAWFLDSLTSTGPA